MNSYNTLSLASLCFVFVFAPSLLAQNPPDSSTTKLETKPKFTETPAQTTARNQMVDEIIAPEGITHPGVLNSLKTVPRHLFVRDDLQRLAYFDQSLPIGHAQTISPPFVVAYMTQTLDPQPTDRVLEIGTGSGFQAAILSSLVKEVYSIEIVDDLAKSATARLKRLGFDNVTVKSGDGYQGWPEQAPFDKIIVTCSPEKVPQPLIDQLQEGGKLLVPLGERYQQTFYLFEKQGGELKQTKLIPTLFVPMTGTSEAQRVVLPDGTHPQLINGSFEEIEEINSILQPGSWHYLRQSQVLEGSTPAGKRFLHIENHDPGRFAQVLQAIPLDGRKIQAVEISYWVRASEIKPGQQRNEQPGIVLHIFDDQRKTLAPQSLQTWSGSFVWEQKTLEVKVPPQAREAILHIGLNGGTGKLDIDEVSLTVVPRSSRRSTK